MHSSKRSRRRSHKSKRPANWALRMLILSVAVCLAAAAAYVAGWLADQKVIKEHSSSRGASQPSGDFVVEDGVVVSDEVKEITVKGVKYRLRDDIESVLIMGVDEAGSQDQSSAFTNNDQADFLLLIVLDETDKSYRSLMINRDTMTRIPALGMDGVFAYWYDGQIALAHTFGTGGQDSCINQCWAVSELLYEVPINHYASLAMPAIGIANDAVGGVTVTVEDDFGADKVLVKGETVKLDAATAERFVRGRQGVADQTNLNRMSRQRTYMAEWKRLAIEKLNSDRNFVMTLLGLVSDYMVSDMTANKLSELADTLASYEDKGVITIEGENKKGEVYMEFYPDEDSLRDTVLELFYEKAQ